MTCKSSVVAGLVAAALVGAAPTVAWAAPASSHTPASSHSSSSTSKGGKTSDKLAGPRRAAQQALAASARQVAGLRSTATAAQLSDATHAELDPALQAASDALTADLASVAQAASVADLNALKQAGRQAVAVARLQTQALTQTDSAASQLSGDRSTLAGLEAAAGEGASSQPGLADADALLTQAGTDLDDVAAAVVALVPATSEKQLAVVRTSVQASLSDAADALQSAEADLAAAH